jgi:DNA polymerase iota
VLKSLPLAVQQKHIIVTCNYEARRRGLYKLQLIKEAKKACPDVIIVLGEDLTRFRNASKELYDFLRGFVWSQKAERLGFDEVFLDVTDLVNFNISIINHNALSVSFFHLDRTDPTIGFSYNASEYAGSTYPGSAAEGSIKSPCTADISQDLLATVTVDLLELRLRVGSHLAQYLRHQLEEQKRYTSTVGISTNKLLSKLVGNVHKPKNQTTLSPPYLSTDGEDGNVVKFMDAHDIRKVPGVGFKLSQQIQGHVLGREAQSKDTMIYGGLKENITVRDVRDFPAMSSKVLDNILTGPGSYKGIGERIWGLLHGVDDTDVGKARDIPRQISIEDSYIRLDSLTEVDRELRLLAASLIRRIRTDLTEIDDDSTTPSHGDNGDAESADASRRWRAHPRVLRLSTRLRPPVRPNGTRARTFTRISRSGQMPKFVFDMNASPETLVNKLVDEALIPLFRKLHPEASGWDLSLVNIAATNMMETAGDDKNAGGRDISKMFKRQDDVLKGWKVTDEDNSPFQDNEVTQDEARANVQTEEQPMDMFGHRHTGQGSEDSLVPTQILIDSENDWGSEDDGSALGTACEVCGAIMPAFAMGAHERFHVSHD